MLNNQLQPDKLRADLALCARALAPSRERAQALIEAGLVYVGAKPVKKCAQLVSPTDELELRGECCPYVSRGGLKLAHALESFHVDVRGLIAVDIGASTGGFTDVLLRAGVGHVYAVDVGTDQLDERIASDPRVSKMEQTNARTLTLAHFPEPPTLAVMDVSFISIQKLLPVLRELLGDTGRVITLVKPQFEAGRNANAKKGVIRSAAVHERVLQELAAHAPQCGFRARDFDFSPISGTQGNIEFLADLIPDDGKTPAPSPKAIRELVARAHRALK